MTNGPGEMFGSALYLLLAMMLVGSALVARRVKASRMLVIGLAWVAIFVIGTALFSFRDEFGSVGQRLRAEITGAPIERGGEIRIPMARDGHFWVNGRINGVDVRFLVDSGATITTIDRTTAARTGVAVDPARDVTVRTANGTVQVARARAATVSIASVERASVALHVTDNDGVNVLGMNFLSSLDRWGVEGHWLVLKP